MFRTEAEKFDDEKFVISDVDPELIFIIPFTNVVRIRSICVIGKNEEIYPNKMKVYKEIENVDFEIAN